MKTFAGITIGPIYDTIRNATVPASLWFSSFFFSDLTRRLCNEICRAFPGADIFSPFYEPDFAAQNDGVGVYHDRILFSAECSTDELRVKLGQIIALVSDESALSFPESMNRESIQIFLKNYLQIHYVILPEEAIEGSNSVMVFSPLLDAMELLKTFPATSEQDPFMRLFANDGAIPAEETRNDMIRNTILFPDQNERYLVNSKGNIRSISNIASNGPKELKYTDYFAVVNADGDGMGKFLTGLNDADVKSFSEACLQYAQKASEQIYQYGGMPIYAGGDDLLFLAPVCGDIGGKRGTIMDLCKQIHDLFGEKVSSVFSPDRNLSLPTLSFGISVQYERFPLYEAFAKGRELLEAHAKRMALVTRDHVQIFTHMPEDKREAVTVKDNIALNLRKHSGQSFSLLIHNPDYKAFSDLTDAAGGMDGKMVNAVLYTISHFRPLLTVLCSETRKKLAEGEDREALKNAFLKAWGNLFDNPGQGLSAAAAKKIGEAFYDGFLAKTSRIAAWEEDAKANAETDLSGLNSLVSVLSWVKFLHEKAGEDR